MTAKATDLLVLILCIVIGLALFMGLMSSIEASHAHVFFTDGAEIGARAVLVGN